MYFADNYVEMEEMIVDQVPGIELSDDLWLAIINYLPLTAISALRVSDRRLHGLASHDVVWSRIAKQWAKKYGRCSQERGNLTPYAYFQQHVFRCSEIQLLQPAVSIYNSSYYCVVNKVDLTPAGAWVSYLVRGDMTLGHLQEPSASRLLFKWAEENVHPTAHVPGPTLLRRGMASPTRHEVVHSDASHVLSGRLFYPSETLQLDSFWSFQYGEAGYRAAPLFKLPSSRVPREWRWPAHAEARDGLASWWPVGEEWLPKETGLYPDLG